MKSLKTIVSFIIPLTAMLITFAIFLITTTIVQDYKIKISNDYSIIVVAKLPLLKENLQRLANIDIKTIQTLEKDTIIENIKNELNSNSIQLLKQKLPYFYEIYLERYPTTFEIVDIKKELLNNPSIKKVEVFSKNHNQVYLLLRIIQSIVGILFFVILIYSVIIISKQIKIWFYEHQERISIMRFHGASIMYSAASLVKEALVSSLISFCIVMAVTILLTHNLSTVFPPELQAIIPINLSIQSILFKVFFLSFSISLTTILGVLFAYKLKND